MGSLCSSSLISSLSTAGFVCLANCSKGAGQYRPWQTRASVTRFLPTEVTQFPFAARFSQFDRFIASLATSKATAAKMMSVKELFYGNQPVTSWMMSTPVPQAKQYSQAPSYHGSSHDRDSYSGAHSGNYYNHSTESMPRLYGQHSLHPLTSDYSSSGYMPSSRQHEMSAWGSSYDRPQHRNGDYSYYDQSHQGHQSLQSHNNQRHLGGSALHSGLQLVELRVPLCCEACEERLSGHLRELRGVEMVRCDHYNNKVVVRGRTAPAELLRVCMKLFKGSEFWTPSY